MSSPTLLAEKNFLHTYSKVSVAYAACINAPMLVEIWIQTQAHICKHTANKHMGTHTLTRFNSLVGIYLDANMLSCLYRFSLNHVPIGVTST